MDKYSLLFFSAFILALLLSGCFDDEICCPPPPTMDVSISYIHDSGVDLLQQDTASLDLFNVYYLHKDEESGEFMREPAVSNQFSFYRDQESARVALRVFPNREFVDGISLTLIEFPSKNLDTLKVQGRKEGRGSVAEIIWYNGEKVWETSSNPPRRFFTFTKSIL